MRGRGRPCQVFPEWDVVLAGEVQECFSSSGNDLFVGTTTGFIGATDVDLPPLGGGCQVGTSTSFNFLSITPEEGAACEALLATFCP